MKTDTREPILPNKREEEEYYAVPTLPVDELIHTEEQPFCTDLSCPCYEDQQAIMVLPGQIISGLLTPYETDQRSSECTR